MHEFQYNGVLLAGGMSRRFGSPKAFAIYKDKFFFQWILDAMEPYMEVLTIVSHESIRTRFSSEDNYLLISDEDRFQGFGPLAGIYSAMKKVDAEWYFILACDMPNISADFIGKMLKLVSNEADMIIPKIKGKEQPLAGLYHHSVLKRIEYQLEDQQYRMKSLLDSCNPLYVNEHDLQLSEELFKNVNNQDEYLALKWKK